ncbi:hypothetical protein BvCmsKSP007_04902 [Escherichia coli]|nr:hypothetical protein BvCmsKSP007_04902 [Escherichia coli]
MGELFTGVHRHGLLCCLRTCKTCISGVDAEIFTALKLCARCGTQFVCLNQEGVTGTVFPVQRHCCHIQRHRSIAVGDRFFTGAQRLRTDRQPFAAGQHTVLCHILRLQHQYIIAHQRTCTGQFPTGRDIHFALRASAAALGKVAGIHGQGTATEQGATVAERCTAERQGSPLNSTTVIQRAGIESRMTFRQQYSVLCQRGGAGREILPGGYLSLCCQRVTGDSHDIAGRVNLAGGILCDVFRGKRYIPASSQFFILLSDSAAGGQAEVLVAVKRSIAENDIAPAADAQVTSRFMVAG